MTGLLPRLLRRLDTNTVALATSTSLPSSTTAAEDGGDYNIQCQMQTHLTGMLSHSLERM
jgi:hypothetical protein